MKIDWNKRLFYHANFCAECGNELAPRFRWRPVHFCDDCAARLGAARPTLAAALGLALLLGVALRRPAPPAPVSARDAILAHQGEPAPLEAREPPAPPVEERVFCGARTKKGTPCRHRVPPGQRCAQHRGRP